MKKKFLKYKVKVNMQSNFNIKISKRKILAYINKNQLTITSLLY